MNFHSNSFKTCVICLQGAVATLITMPLDVMKTRMMNAPPGMYSVSETDLLYKLASQSVRQHRATFEPGVLSILMELHHLSATV